ncbi:DUF222 domain-containing protein, partial [Mycobacterium hodleri]|uniref:DUF222 domain-containing protein n=1 Tax=Mycolicibacterium hodleri TaxID=49897 RepID=UPI0027E2C239
MRGPRPAPPPNGSSRSESWCRCIPPIYATDAVTLEVAAALGISRDLAASHVRYAHALRFCLPRLGRAFIAGDIDETTFRACVFRTGLIVDDDTLAAVDAELAISAPRWGSCNRSQLAARIDRVIAKVDLDAVRRRRDRLAGRDVVVGDVDNGLAEIHATVSAPDGHAFNDRPRSTSTPCGGAVTASPDATWSSATWTTGWPRSTPPSPHPTGTPSTTA